MGDDLTDEHLFQALPESSYTIKIGQDESYAKYRINSVKATLKLLDELTHN
jgi:trehalose 6-phosphate synthase/phosphatase